MRATIVTVVVAMVGCASTMSQSEAGEREIAALVQPQQAVLAVFMFRGDVARGETAIDRCTATLHGGATTMLRLPAAIPGVRIIGQEPEANGCALPVDSSGRQVVLLVDSLEVKTLRDSVYGRERPTVVIVTTTHSVNYQQQERYILGESRLNPAGPPWQVREFEVLSEAVGDRAGPVP
jgi:hypothetical protein